MVLLAGHDAESMSHGKGSYGFAGHGRFTVFILIQFWSLSRIVYDWMDRVLISFITPAWSIAVLVRSGGMCPLLTHIGGRRERSIVNNAGQTTGRLMSHGSRVRPMRIRRRRGATRTVIVIIAAMVALAGVLILVSRREDDAMGLPNDDHRGNVRPTFAISDFSGDSFVEPDSAPTNALVDRPTEHASSDDAAADGWTTEVLHAAVKQQLKGLSKLLEDPSKLDLEHLKPYTTDDVSTTALRPQDLAEVYRDSRAAVLRWESDSGGQQELEDKADPHQRRDALLRQLKAFAALPEGARHGQVEFKVFRIQAEGEPSTTAYVQWSCRGEAFSEQRNATWRFVWQSQDNEPLPRIAGIELIDHEEVLSEVRDGVWFSDCTESVLGGNESFSRQLVRGEPFWNNRIQSSVHATFLGIHGGLALGDVDGDGLDDLYVCQPGGLPNRLYVHRPDGTAEDISRAAAVDWLDYTSSALILDFDNDGDQDLAVLTLHGAVMMENDGAAHFTVHGSISAPSKPTTMAASDYDGDGDLDLYIVCYGPGTLASSGDEHRRPSDFMSPVPYDDANNGAPNYLFRNDGSWKFVDVTHAVGLDENNRRWSYAAGWEDYDNDGDPDLYVANDFGRNCLYRNDQGHFSEVARASGVEDIASGMSVSWGDYNNDGLMDLYVGNMFSAAGGRITYQRLFKPGVSKDRLAQFQRMARGNSLFENQGDGKFQDVSEQAAVTMGRWAWSSRFGDVNNDGREDIVVANGFITNEDTHDL